MVGRVLKKTWLTVACVALASCATVTYQDDTGFLVAAQADSPEFPVYVDSHLCVDMEGTPGLCAKRIKSTDDIVFTFDPQNYTYLLTIQCTPGVTPPLPLTVPAGQPGKVTISAADVSQFLKFTCEGAVSPQDRAVPIAGDFEVHFSVYDARYVPREAITIENQGGTNYLVLGEYARSAWVFDNGKWSQHSQEPIVKLDGDPAKAKAYSESYAMRYNFFHMGDADGGVDGTVAAKP